MVLQDVHLEQDGHFGEGSPVKVKKFDDVVVCRHSYMVNTIKPVTLAYLTLRYILHQQHWNCTPCGTWQRGQMLL